MVPNFEIISALGPCFGQIGLVLLAKRADQNLLAVKKLDLDRIETKDLLRLQKELLAIRQLKHPALLSIDSCFTTNHCLYVISEVAGYGSCADLIANHFPQGLNEKAISLVVKDVASALKYLHDHRIIHRAIRARHILISGQERAILTNLRHAVVMEGDQVFEFSEADYMNLNWLSPELLAQDVYGYDEKSDIYSLGITCLELATGNVPYNDVTPTCMLVEKLTGWLPDYSQIVSRGLQELIKVCTLVGPHLRPSAAQLLTLDWIKGKNDFRNALHPVIPLDGNLHHLPQATSEDVTAMLTDSFHQDEFCQVEWDF